MCQEGWSCYGRAVARDIRTAGIYTRYVSLVAYLLILYTPQLQTPDFQDARLARDGFQEFMHKQYFSFKSRSLSLRHSRRQAYHYNQC